MVAACATAVKRRIVLADVAGYCFGVKRAVEITEEARRERFGKLTTLGPIIHNEQVISKMQAEGIDTSPTLEQITEGTVVLSAHGVSPDVVFQARQQGLNILDVTCPFVTKVHRTAKMLWEQGYQVLLVGDEGHTEVRGVVGAVRAIGGEVTLVSTPEQVRDLTLSKKVGIVSQTTQRNANYCQIVAEVCARVNEVRAVNTICNATDELQDAAVRLARQTDVVIVVGGRKSANTRRLRQLCEEQGVPAYHIETAEEIEEWWLEGKEAVGITAGASTPDWIIEAVASRLNGGSLPDDWRLHHPDE
jgi:4-hydroxy-3-methylbut-2-enyl diphosphate reductase